MPRSSARARGAPRAEPGAGREKTGAESVDFHAARPDALHARQCPPDAVPVERQPCPLAAPDLRCDAR